MFDPQDPHLLRLRELCSEFPEVEEKISHGRPAFYTKKVFAHYGGSVKTDDGHVRYDQSVLILPDEDERPALIQDDRFFHPAYLGPSGWVGMVLKEDTDWDEVQELLEMSYRNTAPKRAIAQLD